VLCHFSVGRAPKVVADRLNDWCPSHARWSIIEERAATNGAGHTTPCGRAALYSRRPFHAFVLEPRGSNAPPLREMSFTGHGENSFNQTLKTPCPAFWSTTGAFHLSTTSYGETRCGGPAPRREHDCWTDTRAHQVHDRLNGVHV